MWKCVSFRKMKLTLLECKTAGRFTEKDTVLQLFFLGFNNIYGAELQKKIFLWEYEFFQNLFRPLIKLFIVNTALFNQNRLRLITKQFYFTNSLSYSVSKDSLILQILYWKYLYPYQAGVILNRRTKFSQLSQKFRFFKKLRFHSFNNSSLSTSFENMG